MSFPSNYDLDSYSNLSLLSVHRPRDMPAAADHPVVLRRAMDAAHADRDQAAGRPRGYPPPAVHCLSLPHRSQIKGKDVPNKIPNMPKLCHYNLICVGSREVCPGILSTYEVHMKVLEHSCQ